MVFLCVPSLLDTIAQSVSDYKKFFVENRDYGQSEIFYEDNMRIYLHPAIIEYGLEIELLLILVLIKKYLLACYHLDFRKEDN